MPANLENSAVATGSLWKRSAFISIPKKGNAKECSNYHIIVLISHASKRLCSKSFKLGFRSMWTKNFQMYKLGLEKAEEPEIKLSTLRKQGSSRKTSPSLIMLKPLTVSVQFSCSVMSNSLHPMNCNRPGLPVHHQLLEPTQTHVHWLC